MPDSLIVEAIRRVQNMRDELRDELGTTDEERETTADLLDSEEFGRHFGSLDAYSRVLDVLQILARGGTPAQGE